MGSVKLRRRLLPGYSCRTRFHYLLNTVSRNPGNFNKKKKIQEADNELINHKYIFYGQLSHVMDMGTDTYFFFFIFHHFLSTSVGIHCWCHHQSIHSMDFNFMKTQSALHFSLWSMCDMLLQPPWWISPEIL